METFYEIRYPNLGTKKLNPTLVTGVRTVNLIKLTGNQFVKSEPREFGYFTYYFDISDPLNSNLQVRVKNIQGTTEYSLQLVAAGVYKYTLAAGMYQIHIRASAGEGHFHHIRVYYNPAEWIGSGGGGGDPPVSNPIELRKYEVDLSGQFTRSQLQGDTAFLTMTPLDCTYAYMTVFMIIRSNLGLTYSTGTISLIGGTVEGYSVESWSIPAVFAAIASGGDIAIYVRNYNDNILGGLPVTGPAVDVYIKVTYMVTDAEIEQSSSNVIDDLMAALNAKGKTATDLVDAVFP